MLLPAVPPVAAVTVTVWQGVGLQPLVNAAVASTLVFELTEVAKFVASAMGLKEIAKCVGSTVGSAPPAKLGPVHAKSSKPSESAMLSPAVPGSVAKTVTVLPLAVERTPTAPPFRSMAAARFAAIVVVTRTVLPDQIWKFERVFEPSVPAGPVAEPRVAAAQEF